MTLIGKESKSVLKGILVFFVVFLFLSSEQFSPLNPLVYKTKLWVEDTIYLVVSEFQKNKA